MPPPDHSLSRQFRLRLNAEFQRVFAEKKSAADDLLVVYALRNRLPNARLGVCVSRKFGSAVARNRWKRRLREAFRLRREHIPGGFDYVVLPRSTDSHSLVSAGQIQQSLVQLTGRASRRCT